MRVKDAIGEFGERLAVEHLRDDGMEILARRWRCALGEVDVVAVDDGCLVVVEVKTRRSVLAGEPVEAVTAEKLGRLRRLTGAWLAQQERHWPDVRIDVVAVRLSRTRAPHVDHLRGVG